MFNPTLIGLIAPYAYAKTGKQTQENIGKWKMITLATRPVCDLVVLFRLCLEGVGVSLAGREGATSRIIISVYDSSRVNQ